MSIKVTVLGSGTPIPSVDRAGPGFVVHLQDRLVQVDAGGDCVRRQLEADIAPQDIIQLFITHLHTDHIVGFGHFVMSGWTKEGRERLDVFGPPGTERMREVLFDDLYREDIEYRLGLGRSGRGLTDMTVKDSGPGVVIDDGDLKVTTAEGIHSFYDLAYRFDQDGQSVVFTGDTAPSDKIVALAEGADALFHDCTLAPSVHEFFLDNVEGGAGMWEKMQGEHSGPETAGQVAEEAGVNKLVLVHVHPGADAESMRSAASSTFSGEVIVAEDLAEIDI